MINDEQEERAALYALDCLPDDAKRAFERELISNAELARLVNSFRAVAELMAIAVAGAKKERAPDRVKAALLARLDAMEGTAGAAAAPVKGAFKTISTMDSEGWRPLPLKGCFIKELSKDTHGNYAVVLVKLAPGTRFPGHEHKGTEDCYVLEGDVEIEGQRIEAHTFHHAEANTVHGDIVTRDGCCCLLVLSTADYVPAPDGSAG